jgi:hypothetical protein
VKIHDISMSGTTFHVDGATGAKLLLGTEVQLRFQVPKSDHVLVYDAQVRNLKTEAKGVRVGVEMTVASGWETKRNVRRAVAALGDYIDRRVREMERYNSAYN